MQGLSWEAFGGLVGVVLVFTSSSGFEPLRGWCRTRSHAFWGWLVAVLGDPLWVGFCLGFAWAIYSGNGLFNIFLMGGLTAVAAHVAEELLAILGSLSRTVVRRFAMPQNPMPRRPQGVPDSRLPNLSEDEAHAIMDDHDDKSEPVSPAGS